MRRLLPPLVLGSALLAACADDATRTPTGLTPSTISANQSANANGAEKMDPQDLPQNAHVFFARGQAGGPNGGSPNLTYHGGPVMHSPAVTMAIFWGTSWNDAKFVLDKMDGMDSFYAGYDGSGYSQTNTEYKDASGTVTSSTTYLGHVVDLSPGPTRAPSTSDVVNEVCTAIRSAGRTPDPNGYYAVYVDLPRGHLRYCAWHSHGLCGGTDVQVGLVLNLDGDPGCDPGDGSITHSQGLEAIANVSGHELSEAVTDPDLNAWYDSSGAENADKCAWSFSGSLVKIGSSSWKVQGNWSNKAYDAGTGYANNSGQKGCIDGH